MICIPFSGYVLFLNIIYLQGDVRICVSRIINAIRASARHLDDLKLWSPGKNEKKSISSKKFRYDVIMCQIKNWEKIVNAKVKSA